MKILLFGNSGRLAGNWSEAGYLGGSNHLDYPVVNLLDMPARARNPRRRPQCDYQATDIPL